MVKPIGLPRDNRTLRSKPISQFFSVVTVRSLSLVSPCAAEAYVFIFFKHSKLTAHEKVYFFVTVRLRSRQFRANARSAYNKNRKPYSILRHNCGTFAADVINQDESVDAPCIINPTPVNIVDEYQEEGNAAVKYDPNNNKTTIGKGDESDAKKN